jgi:ferritin
MMKIYKYVNDVGGRSVSPELRDIQHDFDSLRSVFEEALEQEVTNTQAINRVVDACYKLKDYPTIEFMQWFLKEQVEEEFVARRHVELFDVIGAEGVGLYMIDKQIPKTKYDAE